MPRPAAVLAVLAVLPLLGSSATVQAAPQLMGPLPGPLPLFPASNWWNLDISAAPVDPGSAAFISFIGAARGLHPDLGGDVCTGCVDNYGMSYIVVDSTQPKRAVEFLYADESDGVDHSTGQSFPFYPIPDEAASLPHWVEGGPPGSVDLRDSADRHILIVDRDNRDLYELWNCWYDAAAGQWRAGSGAFFDLDSNTRRPDGWTSADAAGLAVLPGLIRHEEAFGLDEIRHAFRVTVRATNGYVWPASHRAGSTAGALPMGARLRLKSGVDVSGFPPEAQRIFRAMKQYGLIVADNGSDLYVTGTYDNRWDNGVLNPAFAALKASDFEVIQLGWNPPVLPSSIAQVAPASGTTAGGTTIHVTGSGFQAGAKLKLGGIDAAVIAIPSAAEIVALTPAHAAGSVTVEAFNPDLTGAARAAGFTYCAGAPPAPLVTAPLSAAIGSTGLAASVPPAAGQTFDWTVLGGPITAGQGSASIRFSAGAPGTTMAVGAVAVPAGGCASASGAALVQVDFADVPPADPFRDWVNTLARSGVTAGCQPGLFCPDAAVSRAQMAVFLLRAAEGRFYAPPPPTGLVFSDVPAGAFAAAWIEELARRGITGGCGGGAFCPEGLVTRAQMAVFLLRATHGPGYAPPPATGQRFSDVPAGAFAADWIEQLALEGITGGCGGGAYCPASPVQREQMAVFLVRAFGLS